MGPVMATVIFFIIWCVNIIFNRWRAKEILQLNVHTYLPFQVLLPWQGAFVRVFPHDLTLAPVFKGDTQSFFDGRTSGIFFLACFIPSSSAFVSAKPMMPTDHKDNYVPHRTEKVCTRTFIWMPEKSVQSDEIQTHKYQIQRVMCFY